MVTPTEKNETNLIFFIRCNHYLLLGLLLRVLRTDERPVFFRVPYLVTDELFWLYISIIFLKLEIDIEDTSDPICSVKILHAPLVICFRKVMSAIL